MRRPEFLWAAAVGVMAVLGSGRAEAGLLALEVTGSFGPTSTLGGVPFGVDTPYKFRAVFDSKDDVNPTPGAGYFRPTHFTITIARHGTFAGIPNADLNVVVLDPSYHLGAYAAGLVTSTGSPFFLHTYSAVSPPFRPENPTPTTFSGFRKTLASFPGVPYVIPLAGCAGELVINDFGDAEPSASLIAVRCEAAARPVPIVRPRRPRPRDPSPKGHRAPAPAGSPDRVPKARHRPAAPNGLRRMLWKESIRSRAGRLRAAAGNALSCHASGGADEAFARHHKGFPPRRIANGACAGCTSDFQPPPTIMS